MTTNYMDDPFSRDLKRIETARRMVWHQARTQTVTQYTGITRNRLATLRRRWGVPEDTRRRGPAPSSLTVFVHSPQARSEAAAIATVCIAFQAMPPHAINGRTPALPSLALADRLLEAYEAYRAAVPDSEIEFEELLLLVRELAEGKLIELGICRGCKSVILVLRYGTSRRTCLHCDRHRAGNPAGEPEIDEDA